MLLQLIAARMRLLHSYNTPIRRGQLPARVLLSYVPIGTSVSFVWPRAVREPRLQEGDQLGNPSMLWGVETRENKWIMSTPSTTAVVFLLRRRCQKDTGRHLYNCT